MATSDIQICSNALIQLNDAPINSFDDGSGVNGSNRGRACQSLWPTVRDSVLRSHPWNCAKRQVQLAKLASAPAFDFKNEFALPSDWLRTVSINKRDAWDNKSFFKILERKILTDQSSVYLTYIFRNTDVSSYDSILIEALELKMAAKLALTVTGRIDTKNLFEQAYRDKLRDARNIDGQEESADYFDDNLVLEARDSSAFHYNLTDYS